MNYEDIRLNEGFMIQRKFATLTDHDMHTHDALEISIVLTNTIKYKQLKQDFYGSKGDIFLYRPFEPHWTLTNNADQPAEWIMVLFSPSIVNILPLDPNVLIPFYTTPSSPLITSNSEYASEIQKAALLGLREQNECRIGWESRRLLCLMNLLILIYRHYIENQQHNQTDPETIAEIIRTIQFITKHLSEKILLDPLIRKTSLGKTQFYHKFKEVTGVSPNQFIQRLRLQFAMHLLDFTHTSITNIAYDCGFETVSYFNRCFKKYTGTTPREHRKRAGMKK